MISTLSHIDFGLSENEIEILKDIVDNTSNVPEAILLTNQIFKADLTQEHIAVVAYLIGLNVATCQAQLNLNQIVSLCQRLN